MAADISASIKNWSTTEGSNSPSGSTAISTNLDDNLRAIQAAVRLESASDSIASASTTDLSTKDAKNITVTGTTTITALGTVSAGISKVLIFSGALTLTHNATSLILPSATNLTTAAGDVAEFLSLGSGNWRCISYLRASGLTAAAVNTFSDGSVSAPGIAFTSDTNTGLYRIGADQFGVAANGANIATFGTTSVTIPTLTSTTATVTTGTVSGVLGIANGSVGTPSVSFSGDPDTGIYLAGANQLGISANGANMATFGVANVTIPNLVSTAATITTVTATAVNASGACSIPSISIGSGGFSVAAPGGFTFNSSSSATYQFNGTYAQFNGSAGLFATVGTTGGYTYTGFQSPGAGAAADQLTIGQHPGGVYTGVTASVLMNCAQGLNVRADSSISNTVTIYAENTTTNAIYVFKSGPDPIWRVNTSGATFADGAYSGSGADYAEAFLFTGQQPQPGDTVALDGDRVRIAVDGDDIIGVVSERACAIGDAKLLEQGGIPVGLVGKLRINPGRPIRPEWRRLAGEMYLVK